MCGVLFVITIPKSAGNGVKNSRKNSLNNNYSKDSLQAHNEVVTIGQPDHSNGLIDAEKKLCEKSLFLNNVDSGSASSCLTVNKKRLVDGSGSIQIVEDSRERPMEDVLKELLKVLNIMDAAWSGSLDNMYHQITFSVSGRIHSERVLKSLRNAGFGVKFNTSLSVLPCSLHYCSPLSYGTIQKDGKIDEDDVVKQSMWKAFLQSVRARQTVAQVVEQIKAEASLTFDFIFSLVVAALVAALGLVENSTVFLVASMLISPLMGPITASTFGTAIRDRQLLKMGILHELFGLFLALVIGFLFGLIICGIDESYGVGEWPTYEIMSRCDLRSLWIGALIAIPSGAAVAIAILSDNTASLVGVAISASLLPPAVNAGLLWAMSLIHLVFINDKTRFTNVVKTQVYSDNQAIELAVNGFISLCLTLVNIVCIYIAGILVYKIKEVAPTTSSDEEFWKHGVKALRNYNKGAPEDSTSHVDLNKSCTEDLEETIGDPYDSQNCRQNLFTRMYSTESNYSTWSPRILSRRVSAKEFHNYYRQFSDDFPVKRHHRLSFPVNHLPTYKRLDQDCQNLSKTTEELTIPPENTIEIKSKFTVVSVNLD